MPRFRKIKQNYRDILPLLAIDDIFATEATKDEARHTITVDKDRTSFVDFNGKTFQSLNMTWDDEKVSNAYSQGNMDASIFDIPFVQWSLNKFNEEGNENNFALLSEKSKLCFAFYDDSGIPCGCNISYNKEDPSKWVATIIRNTPVEPEKREVSIYCFEGLLAQSAEHDLSANEAHAGFLQDLHSANIQKLLKDTIQSNGNLDIAKLEELQTRMVSKQNLDNRDEKQPKLAELISKIRAENPDKPELESFLKKTEQDAEDDVNFYEESHFNKVFESVAKIDEAVKLERNIKQLEKKLLGGQASLKTNSSISESVDLPFEQLAKDLQEFINIQHASVLRELNAENIHFQKGILEIEQGLKRIEEKLKVAQEDPAALDPEELKQAESDIEEALSDIMGFDTPLSEEHSIFLDELELEGMLSEIMGLDPNDLSAENSSLEELSNKLNENIKKLEEMALSSPEILQATQEELTQRNTQLEQSIAKVDETLKAFEEKLAKLEAQPKVLSPQELNERDMELKDILVDTFGSEYVKEVRAEDMSVLNDMELERTLAEITDSQMDITPDGNLHQMGVELMQTILVELTQAVLNVVRSESVLLSVDEMSLLNEVKSCVHNAISMPDNKDNLAQLEHLTEPLKELIEFQQVYSATVGVMPGSATSKDISLLNEVLECANKALDAPADPNNISNSEKLSTQLSEVTSSLWEKIKEIFSKFVAFIHGASREQTVEAKSTVRENPVAPTENNKESPELTNSYRSRVQVLREKGQQVKEHEKKLQGLVNEYLKYPAKSLASIEELGKIEIFVNTLCENPQEKAELSQLLKKEWLPKLSASNDDRIKDLVKLFTSSAVFRQSAVQSFLNLFTANTVALSTVGTAAPIDLLPVVAHAKPRADLRLADFLKSPNGTSWDELFSDHKPQVIHCETKNGLKLPILTYNIARSGPLMIGDIADYENSLASNLRKNYIKTQGEAEPGSIKERIQNDNAEVHEELMMTEKDIRLYQAIMRTQQEQKTPVILLQESTQNFVEVLKLSLGAGWEYKFDGNTGLATFYNTNEITLSPQQLDDFHSSEKVSTLSFQYKGEDVLISNVHLNDARTAKDGEPFIEEFLKHSGSNHFLCGDFNRRLATTDDGFHHNGTNTYFYDLQRGFDHTDGGFTVQNGEIVRLKADVINELNGKVTTRREVTVNEAIAEESSYRECVLPSTYALDGFHKKMGSLASDCSIVVEKNIFNVARVQISAKHDIEKQIAARFPYYEKAEGTNKYTIYPNPQVMHLMLTNDYTNNHEKPISQAYIDLTNQILASDIATNEKENALDHMNEVMGNRQQPGLWARFVAFVSKIFSSNPTTEVNEDIEMSDFSENEMKSAAPSLKESMEEFTSSASMLYMLQTEKPAVSKATVEVLPPPDANELKWFELSNKEAGIINSVINHLNETHVEEAIGELNQLPEKKRQELVSYFTADSDTAELITKNMSENELLKELCTAPPKEKEEDIELMPVNKDGSTFHMN